jgi:hypothetical protein
MSPLTGVKMETGQLNIKKINRKKFFSSLGMGVLGYYLIRSIPFTSLGRSVKDKKVTIRIDPDAVSRTKIGEKNV